MKEYKNQVMNPSQDTSTFVGDLVAVSVDVSVVVAAAAGGCTVELRGDLEPKPNALRNESMTRSHSTTL